MPIAALRPCAKPGCLALVSAGRYCVDHQAKLQRLDDSRRGSASQRGYGSKWRTYREHFLRHHPYCAKCEANHVIALASVVDHIKPHKGDMRLFWSEDNHQSLCKPCHDRKTATEDGGFGRG